MSSQHKPSNKLNNVITMADTNSSITAPPSNTLVERPPNTNLKKKIGPYTYHLNNIVGTGYSSMVYQGFKGKCREVKYAIKVVRLASISKAAYRLLQNQILLIQKVSHPNIIQVYDVYFTNNNCYIVTEFCEGGTLQRYIEENDKVECGDIIAQIAEGCKYLSKQMIVHRDIKPANIMLRQGTWKIGDFGFAYQLSGKGEIMSENYTIGSPLFMPPETLQGNVYSLKNDSFSLGILIYYVMTKKYPWFGNSSKKLLKAYQSKQINHQTLLSLPQDIRHLVLSLVELNMEQRAFISDCNFTPFLQDRPSNLVNIFHSCLQNNYKQQLTLCQYLFYFLKNVTSLFGEKHELVLSVTEVLNGTTHIFQWQAKTSLSVRMESYPKTELNLPLENHQVEHLQMCLRRGIEELLKDYQRNNILRVVLRKMYGMQRVFESITEGKEKLLESIDSLSLHTNYEALPVDEEEIAYIFGLE